LVENTNPHLSNHKWDHQNLCDSHLNQEAASFGHAFETN